MLSNNFLCTLEIHPRLLKTILSGGSPRCLWSASGRWFVDDGISEPFEARLVRGWILEGGRIAAITLAGDRSRSLSGWLLASDHGPDTWRRVLVRLRWPQQT
jgi:hypothetical protein